MAKKSFKSLLDEILKGKQGRYNFPKTKAPVSTKTYLNQVDYSKMLGGGGLSSFAMANNWVDEVLSPLIASVSVGEAPRENLITGLANLMIKPMTASGGPNSPVTYGGEVMSQEEYNILLNEIYENTVDPTP